MFIYFRVDEKTELYVNPMHIIQILKIDGNSTAIFTPSYPKGFPVKKPIEDVKKQIEDELLAFRG